MKKSLLALAVLGAFATGAQAQSTNVTIGGVIRAQVKSYKISDVTIPGRTTANEMRIDDDFTSRFWLTGSEDLGGGLSAIFYVENRFNTDIGTGNAGAALGGNAAANGLGNGDTWVGLKGSWGQVTLGKHTWMATAGIANELLLAGGNTIAAIPTSALYTFSIFDSMGGAFTQMDWGSRRPNSITYRSPNFSGFSGVLGVSASGGAANEGTCTLAGACAANYNDGREVFLQGNYATGPLSASLSYWDVEAEGNVGNDLNQIRLSGAYKFGNFKVGLGIDRASRQAAAGGAKISRTAWAIPVSYAMGKGTIMASYARAGDDSGAAGVDTGAKFYSIGYDYALSRRTAVGVFYTRLANDRNGNYQPFLAGFSSNGSWLQAGENASALGLTVHHSF